MNAHQTVTAADFKIRCLDLFEQIASRRIERLVVTERGKPVAVLTPPDRNDESVVGIHGFLRGSVVVQPGHDLTAPIIEDPFDAEQGLPRG